MFSDTVPCPTCGWKPGDKVEHDPFAEELDRHGIYARRFDNRNRDLVRKLADPAVRGDGPCADCKALVEAFDAAFASHLLD